MAKLSVNINKFATLRNARGGNVPDIVESAKNAEAFGSQGITVHPRPDERHIRYQDVLDLSPIVKTEFNIEGKPISSFMDLVLKVKPDQVTLVPDAENAITSNAGWDCKKHQNYLQEIVQEFKQNNIRVSIFLDADIEMLEYAAKTGADRIELYTEDYAVGFPNNPELAVKDYKLTAQKAVEFGLGVNAGHDLSLDNIQYLIEQIPEIQEVSIGHALICESIYLGFENVIRAYLNKIERAKQKVNK